MTDHEWNVADEQEEFVSNLPNPGGIVGALMPVAGFGVTLRNFFRPTVTEQYPTTPANVQPKYHGRHQLNRYADGLEKCIGCELCAWACPADAILVEADSNTIDAQFSPGERYGRVYQINYLRCIFCGLCIEACPTRALTMTNEIELAGPTREGLIYEKQDLLAPLEGRMLEAPHPMVEGTTDTDYYRGEVKAPTVEQQAWVRAHRPDDATLPEHHNDAHNADAQDADAHDAQAYDAQAYDAQAYDAQAYDAQGAMPQADEAEFRTSQTLETERLSGPNGGRD